MNAQEEWKFLYREMKKDMYFEKYDEAMTRRNSILREAALERKLAAAQREIKHKNEELELARAIFAVMLKLY